MGAIQHVLIVAFLFMLLQGSAQTPNPPFSLVIDARHASLESGAEIDVQLKLTNISKQPLLIVDRNRDCDYSVAVYDEQGARAPATDYQPQNVCNPSFVAGRWITITLKPGESRDDEIAVSKFRDMVQPGKYAVQITRTNLGDRGNTAIPSNKITITVTR